MECSLLLYILSQYYDKDGERVNSATACAIISKVYLYAVMATPDFAAVVTNYMMILFLYLSCNEPHSTPKWLKICLECVCVTVALFFPLIYLWLPVEDGFLSDFCVGNVTCSLFYRDLTIMYSIPVAVFLETVVATVITLCMYCRVQRSIIQKSKQVDVLVQRTTLLVIFNALAFSFILISFVIVIVSGTNLNPLQYVPVTCFVTSLVPVYIEITLVVFFYISVRGSGMRLAEYFCQTGRCSEKHQVLSDQICKTSPPSHPIIQPSDTHFSVPHPDDTHSVDQKETTPLIDRNSTVCCLIS